MDKRSEDSRIKGSIAEHLFIAECAKAGIEICQPVIQGQRYDFLINSKSEWKRVQIKYISGHDGKICVSKTKKQNGRHLTLKYEDDIDLFFVFCPDTNKWYNIPYKTFNRVLILRYLPAKFNISTVRDANKYSLDFSVL